MAETPFEVGPPSKSDRRLDIATRELHLEAEREEIKDNWRCCLSRHTTDSRMIKYICQMVIIMAVMSASIFGIIKSDNCEDSQLWLGILMMLLGYILEAPGHGDRHDS